MDTTENDRLTEKLSAELETAKTICDAARTELDIMLCELVGDLHRNFIRYLLENVKRQLRKKPEFLEHIDDARLATLREELIAAAGPDIERIVDTLRHDPAWYREDMVFLDNKTSVWKTIHSIEPPVNKLLKKYGIPAIKLQNWSWLCDYLDIMANDRYPVAKRLFNEAEKQVTYIQTRLNEELRLHQALDKLEGF